MRSWYLKQGKKNNKLNESKHEMSEILKRERLIVSSAIVSK